MTDPDPSYGWFFVKPLVQHRDGPWRASRSDPARGTLNTMKTLHRIIEHVTAGVIRFCQWMLLLLGITMTLLILLQVFFRFVIYVPFPWSEEAARYLMIWMGMLGSVVALEKGRHIGVDFFMDKLPSLFQRPLRLLVQVVMGGFLGLLFRQGVELCIYNYDQQSPAMEISMLIPFSAIPMGCALMVLVVFKQILSHVVGATPEEVAP